MSLKVRSIILLIVGLAMFHHRGIFTEEARLDFLDRVEVKIGPSQEANTHKTVNGDRFITLSWTHEGRFEKPEGEPALCFASETIAWNMFLTAFELYSEDKNGRIHWRHKPEMTRHCDCAACHKYVVYCRLYINDKKSRINYLRTDQQANTTHWFDVSGETFGVVQGGNSGIVDCESRRVDISKPDNIHLIDLFVAADKMNLW